MVPREARAHAHALAPPVERGAEQPPRRALTQARPLREQPPPRGPTVQHAGGELAPDVARGPCRRGPARRPTHALPRPGAEDSTRPPRRVAPTQPQHTLRQSTFGSQTPEGHGRAGLGPWGRGGAPLLRRGGQETKCARPRGPFAATAPSRATRFRAVRRRVDAAAKPPRATRGPPSPARRVRSGALDLERPRRGAPAVTRLAASAAAPKACSGA